MNPPPSEASCARCGKQELATPNVDAACSSFSGKQGLPLAAQIRLCCVVWAAKLPLGRGSGAAREKRPSAFVINRACHP
ncbi:MAG: hypothetical protein LHW59_05815 [Candidatus Cloacimonetes bacterium]|nr:hypothetical protein [Candidatus Cloacimonadota bacterium]